MFLQIIQFLEVLIIVQSSIFVLYLMFSPSTKQTSNRLLSAFLGIVIFHMVANLLIYQNIHVLNVLSTSLRFLTGPVLYWYTLTVISEKKVRFGSREILHLIPFFWNLLFVSFGLFAPRILIVIGVNLSVIIYMYVAYQRVKSYQQMVEQTRSIDSKTSLQWLQYLFIVLSIITVFDVLNNMLFRADFWPLMPMVSVEIVLLYYLVNSMVYKGLRQPTLFSGLSDEEYAISIEKKEKYAASTVSGAELECYKRELEHLMERKKPYLDPDLTLNSLAKQMSVSTKVLSQVINAMFNKNFSEYINHYRVREFLQIFEESEDQKLTILEVLFDVGFNSKSSFYKAFKLITHQTPKEYLKGKTKQLS